MAEPAPMPFEDLTQVSSCPSPDAATVVRRTQQIANRTDWYVTDSSVHGHSVLTPRVVPAGTHFPTPQTGSFGCPGLVIRKRSCSSRLPAQ